MNVDIHFKKILPLISGLPKVQFVTVIGQKSWTQIYARLVFSETSSLIFFCATSNLFKKYLPCSQNIRKIPGSKVGCLPDLFVHGFSGTRLLLSARYDPLARTGGNEGKCVNNVEGLRTLSDGGSDSLNALSANLSNSVSNGTNSAGAEDSLKHDNKQNNEGDARCNTSISHGNSLTGTLLKMFSQTRRNS